MKNQKNKKLLIVTLMLFVLCIITAACNGGTTSGGDTTKTPDLTEIHDAVVDAYGDDFTATYSGSIEELTSLLSITEDKVDEFFYNIPLISVHADVFIGIKATAGNGEAVETALNTYKDYLTNDSMQYPMNLAKVSSTTVIRHGDYAFLVMLGNPGSDIEDEAEAAEFSKQQTKKGVDIINGYFD